MTTGDNDPRDTGLPTQRIGSDNRVMRSMSGVIGLSVLALLVALCVGTLPWTLGAARAGDAPRYRDGSLTGYLLPPSWATMAPDELERQAALERESLQAGREPVSRLMGTDKLGRSLWVRCLAGGGISITIGVSAAAVSVFIGVLWGAIAGYAGGRVDALMMRIVDVLYGLPYILLVVLLAVAGDAVIDNWASNRGARDAWLQREAAVACRERGEADDAVAVRKVLKADQSLRRSLEDRADAIPELAPRQLSPGARSALDVALLLVAIGGVSWLTMSRVIRGQVLSLKSQPFMEAARAMGLPAWRQFARHLLPNLLGPIIVYATLTVPQAILQESFLSFLGIGVKPPLPSWGNLAAEGLSELNPVRVRWWLIVFPCAMLGLTLLSLNFVGEGLREAFDPKRSKK